MTIDFLLNDELHNELVEAARDCQITAREFAGECVAAVLASRRLPKVYVPALTQGPRMAGVGRAWQREDEDEEMSLVEHRIVSPLHAV